MLMSKINFFKNIILMDFQTIKKVTEATILNTSM
jgi:hypothetical protein